MTPRKCGPDNSHFSMQNIKDKISEQLDTLLITSSLSQSMEHLKNGALDNFYHHILGIKTRQDKYYANLDCEVITFFARWPNQSTSHVR